MAELVLEKRGRSCRESELDWDHPDPSGAKEVSQVFPQRRVAQCSTSLTKWSKSCKIIFDSRYEKTNMQFCSSQMKKKQKLTLEWWSSYNEDWMTRGCCQKDILSFCFAGADVEFILIEVKWAVHDFLKMRVKWVSPSFSVRTAVSFPQHTVFPPCSRIFEKDGESPNFKKSMTFYPWVLKCMYLRAK